LTEVFDMSFLKNIKPVIAKMREEMIRSDEGRIYLVASADAYGYDVDSDYNIILQDGSIMKSNHSDYDSIVKMAKKDARNSPIWGDF
tara:strand:- start:12046 stop:12306 length:261 start_codon:yes stop_codon:yes gene_type:complete